MRNYTRRLMCRKEIEELQRSMRGQAGTLRIEAARAFWPRTKRRLNGQANILADKARLLGQVLSGAVPRSAE